MAGITALRRIQLGRETTAGTAVAATTIWRGIGTIEDQRETQFPDEHVGIMGGVARTYVPRLQGQLDFESVPATFEQLTHIFEAGIKELGSGVEDTGGSGYVYAYDLPTTTPNTPKTYTIEGGDNEGVEEMEHAFVTEFTLDGNAGEAVMVTATWQGRQVVASSFTTPLSIPDVEEILFSKGKLFIDNVDGTAGTTQVANSWLSFSLNHSTGFQPVYTGDGELYFSFVKQIGPEVTLDVTFEHDASSIAEKDAWRAQTPRLIQMLFEGSAFTTAGSDFTNKALIINLVGKWESFEKIGEQNGNDVVAGTFRARYHETPAMIGNYTIANGVSAVP